MSSRGSTKRRRKKTSEYDAEDDDHIKLGLAVKKFSKVKLKGFHDPKDTDIQNQLQNQIYLINFGHTEALPLKQARKMRKSPGTLSLKKFGLGNL